jgi:CBS domain-containing protein
MLMALVGGRYVQREGRQSDGAGKPAHSAAALLMARRKVGAVMVTRDEKLVGIFTERDVVFRVIALDLDVKSTLLADVMTPSPVTIDPGKSFGYALLLMHQNGFRHMPVTEDGKPVGMVSARHALDPDLEEFAAESHRREQIMREMK